MPGKIWCAASMMKSKEDRIRLSATWAAYGDAIGFITELADKGRVEHRAGKSLITSTVPWRRKLGSKIGVFVDFPAGTYSDDTQLRLATSRAIRADGSFDIVAFSKVELPAWANYALGAGIASKEAAAMLARTSATWYSNFYESKRANYVNAGGNGGAMRIQPHVWCARDVSNLNGIFRDVIKNTVCTHGNPRAILGACYHALSLALAFQRGQPLNSSEMAGQLILLRQVGKVIEADTDLRMFWLGPWLEKLGDNLDHIVNSTVDEIDEDLNKLKDIKEADPSDAYNAALRSLGGLEPNSRGSGTKTAILASFLSELYAGKSPEQALLQAANALGSDTDSIGTMAGAILGACTDQELRHPLQDGDYIASEARRLAAVASQSAQKSFGYPDLRSWRPERAAVDAIAKTSSGLILNGIGHAEIIDAPPVQETDDISLQWLKLSFGQTILARVREVPRHVEDVSKRVVAERISKAVPNRVTPSSNLPGLFDERIDRNRGSSKLVSEDRIENLNDALRRIINSGFDPELIGRVLLSQAQSGQPDFVERGIALTANILTAFHARTKKRD
jgi:ADP-ribosylglycohydrolase